MDFDRFDIVEANYIHARDYGEYGILDRLTCNLHFRPSPFLTSYNDLTLNGQDIYDALQPTGPYDQKRPIAHREGVSSWN